MVAYPQAYSFVTVYCMNFIIFCVSPLSYFLLFRAPLRTKSWRRHWWRPILILLPRPGGTQFLAGRTVTRMIGYWRNPVVRLSICL